MTPKRARIARITGQKRDSQLVHRRISPPTSWSDLSFSEFWSYRDLFGILTVRDIKLRYKQPDTIRPFKIIGGKPGVWIIAGLGFLSTVFSGIMALSRPSGVTNISFWGYFLMMIIGTFIWMLPFWLFRIFKKPGWAETIETKTPAEKP